MGNGLCKNCYQVKKRGGDLNKRISKVKPYGELGTQDNETPVSSAAHKYKCLNDSCRFQFTSVYEKEEAICPDCGGVEVESLD